MQCRYLVMKALVIPETGDIVPLRVVSWYMTEQGALTGRDREIRKLGPGTPMNGNSYETFIILEHLSAPSYPDISPPFKEGPILESDEMEPPDHPGTLSAAETL